MSTQVISTFKTTCLIVITHLCHFTGHEWWYHGSAYIIYTFAMTYIYVGSNKYWAPRAKRKTLSSNVKVDCKKKAAG